MRATSPLLLVPLIATLGCGGGGPRLEPSDPGEPAGAATEQTSTGNGAEEPNGDEPPGPMGEILASHNRLRAEHCAPALSWSDDLAETAQDWAEEMVARGCVLEHSDHPHGENLYMGSVGVRTPEGVAEQWHSEVREYDFRSGGFSMETGHFTQLVWAGTRRLGCGQSTCNGLAVWVCMYDPPGNVQGGYAANVKPTSCR